MKDKDIRMPSGKFRGRELWTIPSPYLKWVAENWGDDEIATAADEEWQWREKHNQHIYR